MTDVLFALSLLTPWDIDKPKVRLGPATDGGYIFANDISPEQSILSYGIHTEYRFDEEMAERGHNVYMFDHTIDSIAVRNDRMFFFKEGIAGRNDADARLYTIDDHLLRHQIVGDRLILKLDVEGCEYDSLLGISDESLLRFEQLTIEFHDLHRLGDQAFRTNFINVFQRLNRHFTLFHVHANNYDGPNTFHFVDYLPVPNLVELSYIKTTSVNRTPSKTLYPTHLDYPNIPSHDKILWIYPFFPTTRPYDDFVASYSRSQIQLEKRTP